MTTIDQYFVLFAERERLSKEAATMFDDTLEEYHEFTLIKDRFEAWKWDHSDSYEEAWIGLCLPRLFTPLIRTKLITWNPLEDRSVRPGILLVACDNNNLLLLQRYNIANLSSLFQTHKIKLTSIAKPLYGGG